MTIINGTQHPVNVYNLDGLAIHPTQRGAFLKTSVLKPVRVIEAGNNLNAKKGDSTPLEVDGIPATKTAPFVDADPIPETGYVIVSQLYRAACVALGWDTSRLMTVSGPVYEEGNPRPVGCTSFEVG